MGGHNYKIIRHYNAIFEKYQVGYYGTVKIDIYGLISRLKIETPIRYNIQPCRLCQKNLGDF